MMEFISVALFILVGIQGLSVDASKLKRLRPNFGGDPVNVSVTVFIEFIGDIDEINMEFTTIMYFRQYWKDERLRYKDTGYHKRLAFNPEILKFIWVPDTHFPGIKDGLRHDITAANEVVRLWPDGSVLYSMRLKVTSQCPMDLRNFPMDTQKCLLNIEASNESRKDGLELSVELYDVSYDDKELTLSWHKDNPVTVSNSIEIPSYTLANHNWSSDIENFTTGKYSILTIEFDLHRRLGFHMIQIYLPCYLIVVLAWVSFWVDREQTAARIAMGITTVLTMATLIGSARTSLPKVSYVKSLELFLIMCFLFVFSAILEYAFVSYLVFKNREEEREKETMRKKHDDPNDFVPAEETMDSEKPPQSPGSRRSSGQEAVWIPEKQQVETMMKQGRCRLAKKPPTGDHYVKLLNTVEFFSRLLFPLVFIFLNIAYWIYFVGIVD
ncbi:Gamma-aminobutyric acid receptor subunit beta-3 [Acropora cervicornis]|uniref:Gamma-aminobutyric acid receptor subunit beta-3 n=1 Tax=Acropora cervicornis TaxID=6130 RepID=A0AAD9V930_ACRCE|nr:Gamma-aminobutyric acid receptor subunit beta-3 [Acropora cervicornis]